MEKRAYYEVSHSQKRVWVLSQVEEASISFNIPMTHLLEGKLDIPALEQTFKTLQERHESFRTVFLVLAGEPKQRILLPEEVVFNLEHIDLRGVKEREIKAKELAERQSVAPFDLSRGPLLGVILTRLEEEKFVFFLNIHHITSDYLSHNILFSEMFALYDAFAGGGKNPLTPLPVQYKDYAAWHN
ncbi:MAG: non-ribosomal peptide synthetase, partial [bacterium]|nr:non-ribosomal peptide synthetase [bacterium]